MFRRENNLLARISGWLSVFLVGLMIVTPAAALTKEELYYYSQNNILYYDPDEVSNCTIPVGSYSGETSAGLSETQAGFVDKYHDIAESLSIQYGIPWETVVAQGILESAAGTSYFATNRNNFFGIGAFDSNPNNAYAYATPTEGWQGYYKNIAVTPTYRNHGAFRGETITDPYAYLVAIKAAGYATDARYVEKVSKLILAIENRAAEKGWLSSVELAKKYPEMKTNAAAFAAGEEVDVEYSGVVGCIAAGNGDINQTALVLSWPDRSHDKFDPKPEYTAALSAVGLDKYGERWVQIGASCDAFVATVLRYSGVDPDVACCGARNMNNYFRAHPDMYQLVDSTGNTAVLQPGDILSNGSHVALYVQLQDGSFAVASASHADRTADHAGKGFGYSDFDIFRVIK